MVLHVSGSHAPVERLRLSRSGWSLEWRHDGHWREIDPAQLADEQAGAFTPGEAEWGAWTAVETFTGRQVALAGSTDSVWVLYGEFRDEAPVVVLRDGTQPLVATVGRLWACEWIGPAGTVEVRHTSGDRQKLDWERLTRNKHC